MNIGDAIGIAIILAAWGFLLGSIILGIYITIVRNRRR